MNEDLKEAFGNTSWTAVDLYRDVMMEIAEQSENTLELGTGLTSLDLARAGVHGVGLEHLQYWLGYVYGVGQATGVDLFGNFKIEYSPLRDYGLFGWYDYTADQTFDFVVCDGPPRFTTKGERYGLLPVMHEKLAHPCQVLFDDYSTELGGDGEPIPGHTIEQWQQEFDIEVVNIFIPPEGSPFALLRVP